jgi:hypothetical protein
MMSIYVEKQNDKLLTKNEVYLIRFFLFGFSKEQMMSFYNSDLEYLNQLQNRIESKFATKRWAKIVAKTLELKCLDLIDYTNPIIKNKVLQYVNDKLEGFIDSYKDKFTRRSEWEIEINKEIKKLYNRIIVHYKVQNFYLHSKIKFTEEDICIVNKSYQGLPKEKIAEDIGCSLIELKLKIDSLFVKAKVNNWFAIYRLARKFNAFDDEDLNVKRQINKTTTLIAQSLKSKSIPLIDKKTFVYETLTRAIVLLEFTTVLSSNHHYSFYYRY